MTQNTVKVRVPGTSANCGPGFDALGVACSIYNELEMTLLEEPELNIEIYGEGSENIPTDERNIVWKSAKLLLRRLHLDTKFKGAKIVMNNNVPLSRGLGSSAAAIVAGLKAANALTGNKFSRRQLLQMATSIEGHPDNVAPAIFGGFTVTAMQNGSPECFSFIPRLNLTMVVAVPDFPLSTKAARKVLPESVSIQDAVFNIGRTGMLIAALCKGNRGFLKTAFDDKLHQPYRANLIPGMYDVFEAAKSAGALGASLSGAGPCLIAFTDKNADEVGQAMKDAFAKHDIHADYILLNISQHGAQVIG